jgi:hypothetical protein
MTEVDNPWAVALVQEKYYDEAFSEVSANAAGHQRILGHR